MNKFIAIRYELSEPNTKFKRPHISDTCYYRIYLTSISVYILWELGTTQIEKHPQPDRKGRMGHIKSRVCSPYALDYLEPYAHVSIFLRAHRKRQSERERESVVFRVARVECP